MIKYLKVNKKYQIVKNNKLLFICILILLINLLFFDIYNYLSLSNYNPLGWHEDNLRHHAISRNILDNLRITDAYDSSLTNEAYLFAWPLNNLSYAAIIFLFGDTLGFLLGISLFSIFSYLTLNLLLKIYFPREISNFLSLLTLIIGNGTILFFFKGVAGFDSIIILHRVVNPVFSFPLLYLFQWAIVKFFKTLKPFYTLLAGILFGSLFLSYIYFALYAAVFALIFTFYKFFINKGSNFITKDFLKKIKLPFLYFCISSLPGITLFFKNYFNLKNLDEVFIEWKDRTQILETRSLIIDNSDWIHFLIIIPALLFLLVAYKICDDNKKKETITFTFICYLSAFVSSNSNLITGISPQNTNFTAYLNFPFFTLFFFSTSIMIGLSRGLKTIHVNILFLLIASLITLFNVNYLAIYSQKLQNKISSDGALRSKLNLTISKNESALHKWLDSSEFEGKKILADTINSRRIAAFTKVDTYFIDYLSTASNSLLKKRQRIIKTLLSEKTKNIENSEIILNELKINNVTHIVTQSNLKIFLPHINEKEIGDYKIYRLIYSK